MNIWSIPFTCAYAALIATIPALFISYDIEVHDKLRTDYYLSIRVENVFIDQISDHVKKINEQLQFSAEWIEPEVREANAKFPGGTVFFFNTSDEQWQRLGGEAGYAILLNGRIVWRRRIAIS